MQLYVKKKDHKIWAKLLVFFKHFAANKSPQWQPEDYWLVIFTYGAKSFFEDYSQQGKELGFNLNPACH